MPSANVPRQSDDPRFEWTHIDDFTPGVYDNSFISIAEPKLSAPLGAADAVGTFCCAALTAGQGLGPLPALTVTGVYPNALPGTSTEAFITGFAVNPGLNTVNDELILIFEADDGTDHYVEAFSLVPPSALNNILNSSSATVAGIFGAPYPSWTRMNVSGVGTNPPPELVFPGSVSTDASGVDGHLYIYPPILAPTSFAVQDLIVSSSSVTGQVICYGSRVLCLVGQDYPWPVAGGINTNENVNFTDPPETSTYGNQNDILGVENPWGYGAWGTISVGELMLIKKVGGGLILYGDIDAVTSIIPMPGVESVGDFVGKADATELGLIYCAEDRGAWIWNGGNSSQKISAQLRDDFYDATTGTGLESNNYGFCVGHWQDWILFSNNFMYDPDTSSWWVIYPTDANGDTNVPGHTMWWWLPGRFGNQMYAAPIRFGTTGGLTKNWYYKFDNTVPAPHWQWQSLPIHVDANADRVLDVRQVIVRASDPSSSGHATMTVTVNGQVLGTIPAGDLIADPKPFRFNAGVGVRGINDIVVTINGDNAVSGSSPILHSIDVGYEIRAGVPVIN